MAQTEFEIGFEYKGQLYGWKSGKLYRLPVKNKINSRLYSLKEVPVIDVGNKKGYRLMRDKLSIDQVKSITVSLKIKIEKKHKDLP